MMPKLTIAARLKGARKLVKSKRVSAGLKKWARKFIAENS
jgi:hypothetical protein